MTNITIIGGSGFVGTRLIEILKKKKDITVKNIDKRPSHFYPEITEICNVLDISRLTQLLAGSNVVILLAAEHRDDVMPVSLYYDVNVQGMRNTLAAMNANGIKRIVFTSSVAIYGLNKDNPDETHEPSPFNHYGKSKWQAEEVLQGWYKAHPDWNINILRPSVIFGERNRGNVYNLLRQISGGRFLMVGKGRNKKSMAYVGNIVAFINFMVENLKEGYNVFNYIDKPDFDMNQLVAHIGKVLDKHIPAVHFPYWLGMTGGYCFDVLAWIMHRKLSISSVRVRKFCATTEFSSQKVQSSGFKAPYTLGEGLERTLKFEFIAPPKDDIVFISE